MDRQLFTLHDCEEFHLVYDQYGPLKVIHNTLKKPWSASVARKFKRVSRRLFRDLKEPVFAAFYTDGQHGPDFDKWLRSNGFIPFAPGRYDNTDCIFYTRVQ
jgi:hypothetical protein